MRNVEIDKNSNNFEVNYEEEKEAIDIQLNLTLRVIKLGNGHPFQHLFFWFCHSSQLYQNFLVSNIRLLWLNSTKLITYSHSYFDCRYNCSS